jgi:1-acyl-sn-glycerol-3-phosphate acyltransferase
VSRSLTPAQPPLEFIAPNLDLKVVRLTKWLLPLWMRSKTAIAEVKAENLEQLVQVYQDFEGQKVRVLLAFRHPSVDDPVCIGYTLGRLLPKRARSMGVKLRQMPHAHFMYDRGIPLWAGKLMGQLYSKLGGTPIMRGKVDRAGLKSARKILLDGKFPLLAAPEGGTNGHSEIISPLEPGIAQMAFWCAEDLAKAGRSEKVIIVPIGVQYKYIDSPWGAIQQLLGELERDCGLQSGDDAIGETLDEQLYHRMYSLGEHLLSTMEMHYKRFYHCEFPEFENAVGDGSAILGQRLHRLMNQALRVAEQHFGVEGRGTEIDRCRRLEQLSWELIYREDLNLETTSVLEHGLADRVAEEASLRLWHMRLVEGFVAVTGKYVQEKMTVERFAETLLLTWEMVQKIAIDRPAFERPRLGKKRGLVTIGTPIVVSDRFGDYSRDRRSAKQAVTQLTQDLQTALQEMIR